GHRLGRADDAPFHAAEIVLSALPHGVSGRYVHDARAAGKRAVDLSADFRLSPEAVYGLTEVTRPRVAAAELVANPGCYPTAALPALSPASCSPVARCRPSRTSCTAIAWRLVSCRSPTCAGRGSL